MPQHLLATLVDTSAVGVVFVGPVVQRLRSHNRDQLLKLVAGLTAIFSRDEHTRAARALEVLRVLSHRADRSE